MEKKYNDLISKIEESFDFESIGKEYNVKEENLLKFYAIPPEKFEFRVINLYKYEPQPGYAPIQENTRRFCSQLYLRTQNQNNYLTYEELQSLANPGDEWGVRDVLTYCGNYTTDEDYCSCRHRFVRYKYDTETGNIVRDVTQPKYIQSTAKKNK
jgi:hypothetical protein